MRILQRDAGPLSLIVMPDSFRRPWATGDRQAAEWTPAQGRGDSEIKAARACDTSSRSRTNRRVSIGPRARLAVQAFLPVGRKPSLRSTRADPGLSSA